MLMETALNIHNVLVRNRLGVFQMKLSYWLVAKSLFVLFYVAVLKTEMPLLFFAILMFNCVRGFFLWLVDELSTKLLLMLDDFNQSSKRIFNKCRLQV